MQVSSLVKLVEQIKPKEDSDYFLLHTIISLLSLAVGSEDLPPKDRVMAISDHYTFLGNCHATPPLGQHLHLLFT